MPIKILIVEDDPDLGHLLRLYLESNAFEAHRVFNGEEARAALLRNHFDLLILDVMMPKEDGFALAGKLKSGYPQLPFLFVTARKNKEDILEGLRLGADDYITKPFDADELILRIHNILKRSNASVIKQNTIYQIGLYRFDAENFKLSIGQTDKTLTEKEAQLLKYFCEHQNQLIKRNAILNFLWKDADFFNGRSLDVFVTRLRKLLMDDLNVQIESIRGVGFRFYC